MLAGVGAAVRPRDRGGGTATSRGLVPEGGEDRAGHVQLRVQGARRRVDETVGASRYTIVVLAGLVSVCIYGAASCDPRPARAVGPRGLHPVDEHLPPPQKPADAAPWTRRAAPLWESFAVH